MRPFHYSDVFVNLGEIGEHELKITAMVDGHWDMQSSVSIMNATAHILIGKGLIQELDVTEFIKEDIEWIERVRKAYEGSRQKDWDNEWEAG